MQVVVRTGGQDRDVEVVLRTPEATLGDLARAVLGREPDGPVRVLGRRWPPGCLVTESGLADGGLVELDGGAFVPAVEAPPYEVVAVAGLAAGRRWPLGGPTEVGRGAVGGVDLADPAVSRRHCRLALEGGHLLVADTGALNAVVVDDRVLRAGEQVRADPDAVVRLGPVDLQVRSRREDDRPRVVAAPVRGVVAVNRPPRSAPPPAPEPLALPREPVERPAEPFAVAALVGPLVLAGVMVAVTRDPRFALFSALSPVLGVGTWWEARRRRRTGARRDRTRWRRDLETLAADLRSGAARERERRRDLAPDPAEVLRRAALPSTRLWERRPGDPDALQVCLGTADQRWEPPLPTGSPPAPAVREVLGAARLVAAPVVADLSAGGVLGLVGDRAAALAVARSVVCAAAVGTGPADLTVAVFADPGREGVWDWAKWLPHTRASGGQPWLSADRERSERLLRALSAGTAGVAGGTVLVVLDTAVLTRGKGAPGRELLARAAAPGGPAVCAVVLAPTADALPAACDQVLTLQPDGSAVLSRLRTGERVDDVLAAGLDVAATTACARDLARFDDPELAAPGAGLPDTVRLLPLLELGTTPYGEVPPEAVRERWRAGGPDPGAATPLGVTEHGLFVLDLVRDGAHGLVGGTTGAGKSELLRSLVAGLAVAADPEHLTFVLVDYKGGAAFDACARLPHVVGLVTDLDEQLGARALRALEAELRSRERALRAAGADSLTGYLASGADRPPLPRLVVVVDEFAALARELPDFVASLVGVAQRGRTLGVHLLLATQRPSGAVDDNIRANTNLRVALRVQDAADSTDVLGTPQAAALHRDRPGRAYVRLGPGEVLPLQTALVTCVSDDGADEPVGAAPFAFSPAPAVATAPGRGDGRTDLARLVDAVVAAAAQEGFALPRRPWPEPLPRRVELADVDPDGAGAPDTALVALADDPAGQRRVAAGWDLREGGLLLLGVPGSGTTTALRALALRLAERCSPADLVLHALDLGVGGLADLERLPHTGSVVAAGDRERQVRLLRTLGAELDRRRALGGGEPAPRTVLLVDGLGALRAAYDDLDGLALLDLLARLHAEGPAVGIWLAVAADRPGAVPSALSSVTTQRWLFRLADPSEHAMAGLGRADVPAALPGRAVLLPSRLQAQVGVAADDAVDRLAARWRGVRPAAVPVGVLPASVPYGALGRRGRRDGDVLRLPVGVAEADLGVAELALYDGEGALVVGPARSGRSTALGALAQACHDAGLAVIAAGGRRSPLSGCPAVDRWLPQPAAEALAGALRELAGGGVLLVDDAETVDDPDGALQAVLAHPPPGTHVLAAARADALRTAYGHWTARLRRSRAGLLLRPDVDLDGDLLGAALPRRSPVPPAPGRGYLVGDGTARLVQVAVPDSA